MITTATDQMVIKNIQGDLQALVESIQAAYEQLGYSKPTTEDIRALIGTVNTQAVEDELLVDGLK